MTRISLSTVLLLGALTAASARPTFAGGERFIPLGSSATALRSAQGVTRGPNGNPIVVGGIVQSGRTVSASPIAYHILSGGTVGFQTMPLPGGLPPIRLARDISHGIVAVGSAQTVIGPGGFQSRGLLWDGLSTLAQVLTPLNSPTLSEVDPEDCKCDDCEDGLAGGSGGRILVVGVSFNSLGTALPTLWSSETAYTPQALDLLPGGQPSGAARSLTVISGVPRIAGTAVGSSGASEAVLWSGTQVLTVLPRGGLLAANAATISVDGRFVAGIGINNSFATVPAFWSDADGDGQFVLDLPALPPGVSHGQFNSVRALPQTFGGGPEVVAVGTGFNASFQPSAALIYDPLNGLRPLTTALSSEFGVELQGFVLTEANDLSTGGGRLRICGNGVNGQGVADGWYAEVPLGPPPCPGGRGDANCDGSVDFFDIDPFLQALFDPVTYQGAFCGGSICAADANCDGSVDFFDIDPFLTCLFAGCAACGS